MCVTSGPKFYEVMMQKLEAEFEGIAAEEQRMLRELADAFNTTVNGTHEDIRDRASAVLEKVDKYYSAPRSQLLDLLQTIITAAASLLTHVVYICAFYKMFDLCLFHFQSRNRRLLNDERMAAVLDDEERSQLVRHSEDTSVALSTRSLIKSISTNGVELDTLVPTAEVFEESSTTAGSIYQRAEIGIPEIITLTTEAPEEPPKIVESVSTRGVGFDTPNMPVPITEDSPTTVDTGEPSTPSSFSSTVKGKQRAADPEVVLSEALTFIPGTHREDGSEDDGYDDDDMEQRAGSLAVVKYQRRAITESEPGCSAWVIVHAGTSTTEDSSRSRFPSFDLDTHQRGQWVPRLVRRMDQWAGSDAWNEGMKLAVRANSDVGTPALDESFVFFRRSWAGDAWVQSGGNDGPATGATVDANDLVYHVSVRCQCCPEAKQASLDSEDRSSGRY